MMRDLIGEATPISSILISPILLRLEQIISEIMISTNELI